MKDTIIRVAFETHVRIMASDPDIQRIIESTANQGVPDPVTVGSAMASRKS